MESVISTELLNNLSEGFGARAQKKLRIWLSETECESDFNSL